MRNNRFMTASICAAFLGAMTLFMVSCDAAQAASSVVSEAEETADTYIVSDSSSSAEASVASDNYSTEISAVSGTDSTDASASSGTVLDTSKMFTDRDLEQTANLTGATYRTVSDNETITIKAEGVYVISGEAANAQILVAAGDEDKVQIVLDGVTMTNDSTPCIYVKSADKVFVTTASGSENTLSVTSAFTEDGTTNTDAVIFSKDDLVLNGTGTLSISSTAKGISSKDDLKVTGGTITISCAADGLEANDSIRIADGTVSITTSKDGLHAENDEDNTTGYIYIGGGTLTVSAGDDAVHATTIVQIDAGTLDLTGAECIEGTYIRINDGTVSIAASDDGINAGQKSNISTPTFEINGGSITIVMGSGDTDGIDSNGNLYLNGGTIDITAQSPFDYDGTGQLNGATVIVNGTQTDELTNQMMGGGMHGGFGGGHGGRNNNW